MFKIISEITVPKETASDEFYKLIELCSVNGKEVHKGEVIALMESSKSVFEVRAPRDGFIHYFAKVKEELKVGAVLAVLTDEKISNSDIQKLSFSSQEKSQVKSDIQPRISKQAQQLIEQYVIDPSIFSQYDIVRREDVEKIIAQMSQKKQPTQSSKVKVSSSKPVSPSNNRMVIYGGAGGAKMCIDVLNQMKTFEIVGIVDTKIPVGQKIMGVPVLGGDDLWPSLLKQDTLNVVISFSMLFDRPGRRQAYTKLKEMGFCFPNLIHPRAIIEPSAEMGEGNLILAGAIIGSEATIGNFCYINTGAIVSHEAIIGDNVHLAPGSVVGGRVEIGEGSLIGMCATVYFDLKIGNNVTVINGVNVYKNIEPNRVVKPEYLAQ